MSDLQLVEWGEGERAVLVHGSFGWGTETWSQQRPLADRHRLVIPDRRGFGATPAAGRVDFERDAADVAELLDEPSHLVGHSYGGVVALLAAARRPEAVRSLAVIEPPAFALSRGVPPVEAVIERIAGATAEATDAADYRTRFLRAFGFPVTPARLTDAALRAADSSWHERPPWEAEIPLEALAQAAFPKLVARGAWDKAPPEARERAGAAFHAVCAVLESRLGAEGATFAGAAHRPHELGAPFNARLADFWDACQAPRSTFRTGP